jgi:dihydroorotase
VPGMSFATKRGASYVKPRVLRGTYNVANNGVPSNGGDSVLLLKNAHVIDPHLAIDRVTDVVIEAGTIRSVGEGQVDPQMPSLDLTGCYLSPGWIDIHVHAYGTLGFSDPDSIGVYQGVTSFVEAGGPGIDTLDEFIAIMDTLETGLYVGPFIRPMGLLGLNFLEGNVRTLGDVPITRWLDFAQQNRSLLRYLKCNAIGEYGTGTLKLTKGLSEILDLPLYMHIGEFQLQNPTHLLAPEAFKIAEAGDMITHLYHGNLGRVIDREGKVLPEVRDAQRRGVLFDLGFGGYNFSWDVAEKAYAQDIVPHTISSDLQQFNVVRPVKSLANVMSVMLHLGMTLQEVIERVTAAPAKALSLGDRAGHLGNGMPADITVFRVEAGEFELSDCFKQTRAADRQIVPTMAFKNGRRFDCDFARGLNENNWFLQIAEDHVPAKAATLGPAQIEFLAALADALSTTTWELASAERLDLPKAIELQGIFRRVLEQSGLPLRAAMDALYGCFLDQPFTMQIGLLIIRLDRTFLLSRLQEVSSRRPLAA